MDSVCPLTTLPFMDLQAPNSVQSQRSMTKVHWPPMNKFVCKLHGYIVYFTISLCG